jgi:hypothetical protein
MMTLTDLEIVEPTSSERLIIAYSISPKDIFKVYQRLFPAEYGRKLMEKARNKAYTNIFYY